MPITTWSLNCLNGPSEVSAGSSVTNTARQIAGAVGAPVLVILMETFAALHKQGGASAVAASIFGIQWALRISAMICLAMVLMVLNRKWGLIWLCGRFNHSQHNKKPRFQHRGFLLCCAIAGFQLESITPCPSASGQSAAR